MIYRDFQGLKLSGLGFGAMRLPALADGSVRSLWRRAGGRTPC